MSWNWLLVKADGSAVAPIPPGFADELSFHSQADAETWIGEVWRDLLSAGVDAVILHEDDTKIYGPMSLHPAGEKKS